MANIFKINNEKYIFIHIPKTGGKSINKFLKDKQIKNKNISGHKTYLHCRKFINSENYFSCVRNPWERIVSFYHYINEYPNLKHGLKRHIENLSFKQFVVKLINEYSKSHMVFYPQYKFLINHNKEIVINDIFKLENLYEDYNNFLKQKNINNLKLRKIGKSKHKHYSYYYDNESIELIYNWERILIDEFNYKFENKNIKI